MKMYQSTNASTHDLIHVNRVLPKPPEMSVHGPDVDIGVEERGRSSATCLQGLILLQQQHPRTLPPSLPPAGPAYVSSGGWSCLPRRCLSQYSVGHPAEQTFLPFALRL
ncbi:unnamed protein product [Pleuronectes platessa]|uniref:Uncharacterized protein n=1 Tax=Pleuronectes platessa TaxID=8262 RepID=A0A9N7UWN2_PLEPL|nr:unnamed protein product [Pleuronectes platessa]